MTNKWEKNKRVPKLSLGICKEGRGNKKVLGTLARLKEGGRATEGRRQRRRGCGIISAH